VAPWGSKLVPTHPLHYPGPVDPGCRSAARRRLSSVTTDSIAGLSVDLLFLLYDDSNYVPLGLIMFAVKFSANPTVQTAAEASDSPSRPGLAPSPSGQTRKKAANRRSSMISPHWHDRVFSSTPMAALSLLFSSLLSCFPAFPVYISSQLAPQPLHCIFKVPLMWLLQ
jgi:hypothetical protein